jgi:enterochelin esterase-like enzyme
MPRVTMDRPRPSRALRRRRARFPLLLALAGGLIALTPQASDVSAQLPGSPAAVRLNGGRVALYRINAPSIADDDRSVRVYVPRSYADHNEASRRYPVVYLLHGWPGGDGNWPGQGHAIDTLDSLIANGTIPDVIAVMPNGKGIGLLGRSLYLNSYDGKSRMEDFIAHDLVTWVDNTFRTYADSSHRAVIGLSEGATASLNLAFKHPDVFGACGGHSGQYVIQRDVGMGAVFGPEPGATRVRQANSPTLYAWSVAPRLRSVKIYFDCGTHDGELEDNRTLHRTLDSLEVPHVFREYPGHHGWTFWRHHLRDSLIACLSGMR